KTDMVQRLAPDASGSGYVSLSPGVRHSHNFPWGAFMSRFMSADDHGTLGSIWNVARFPPCFIWNTMFAQPAAHVWSGASMSEHRGGRIFDGWHVQGNAFGNFRSYPLFMDYNF